MSSMGEDLTIEEEEEKDIYDEFGLTAREKDEIWRTFVLLDEKGNGVLTRQQVEDLLTEWSRLPTVEEVDAIMAEFESVGCDGIIGIDFNGFYTFVGRQLKDTQNKELLRNAFAVFDHEKNGEVWAAEIRHALHTGGWELTTEEIDYISREEDDWKLNEGMAVYEDYVLDMTFNYILDDYPEYPGLIKFLHL